jgi:hypothetical protein
MLAARVILGVIGTLYGLVGLWCAVKPEDTAKSIGFTGLEPGGRSEYLAVYGGLQLGLALVYLAAALRPEYTRAGLGVCILTHAAMVACRGLGYATISGLGTGTLIFVGIETLFLILGLAGWMLIRGS